MSTGETIRMSQHPEPLPHVQAIYMQALHDRVRQPTRLGALALEMLQMAGDHLLARGYALSVQASVLSIVGAVQFSLHNREDGDLLSERAWRLPQGGERNQLWGLVTINRLSALMLTDRNAQALPLVEAYLEAAPSFNVLMQAKCPMAAATVLAHLGQTDRAQRLLDDGVARHQDLGAPASDGAWLQAMLWHQTGRHTEALALCSERLFQSDAPDAQSPVSRARPHTEAVRACEDLGELAQALSWYRELAATERLLSDEAARSRRLTLHPVRAADPTAGT